MKRTKMVDRLKLLAEKRAQLFEAARDYAKAGHSVYSFQQATIEMETRAVAYAVACFRYIGGERP